MKGFMNFKDMRIVRILYKGSHCGLECLGLGFGVCEERLDLGFGVWSL